MILIRKKLKRTKVKIHMILFNKYKTKTKLKPILNPLPRIKKGIRQLLKLTLKPKKKKKPRHNLLNNLRTKKNNFQTLLNLTLSTHPR